MQTLKDAWAMAKYWAKGIWALAVPAAVDLIDTFAVEMATSVQVWISTGATALMVWLVKNGPKPAVR